MKLLNKFLEKTLKIFKFRKKCFCINDINNFNTKTFYTNYNTVFISYIKQNIDILLADVIRKLKKYCDKIYVGVEIEFYVDSYYNNNLLKEKIINFCKKNNINIIDIEKECGNNQIEVKFEKYSDIYKLIEDYNNLKLFLIENFKANFDTFPYLNDVFSALQLNVNLVDINNKNLFSRELDINNNKVESELLINSVNGILSLTNILLPLYIKDKNCLKRFDFEINNNIYSNGKTPAPTFLSWGINNRTASIRIPTPKDFINYEKVDNESRRIEFRVPSSNADIKFSIFGVFISMLYGLDNKLNLYEKSNFNILKNHENLESISINNISMENKKLYEFVKNYF